MKKLLLIIYVLLVQANVYSQPLPNGNFENWSSTLYMEPTTYNTGNLRDIEKMGVASVTQVTGFSGYGVRIETIIIGSDTSDSYIVNTANPCTDPPNWVGGVPYSQQPTAINGYFRYNLPGNDSALLIVIFRQNGVHIGDNFILIRNATGSQSTWAPFSFPVTCAGVPDSIIIAAASSNKMSNTGVQNGSFIELDNLAFAGTTQAIPNGDFQNWTNKSYDVANGWEAWGQGVSKTGTSQNGTFAIRLETMGDCGSGGYVNASGITSGYMTSNNGPAGGRPYNLPQDTLCGYYKYAPVGGDSAFIGISLSLNATMIGGNGVTLPAASGYTYFEIPFGAWTTPDTVRFDIQSSKWPTLSSYLGSVLYVDNLYLKSLAVGISENHSHTNIATIYPNPIKDILTIDFGKNISGSVQVIIYDATGRVIKEENSKPASNLFSLHVEDISAGIYFCEIKTPEGITRNKFVKQ